MGSLMTLKPHSRHSCWEVWLQPQPGCAHQLALEQLGRQVCPKRTLRVFSYFLLSCLGPPAPEALIPPPYHSLYTGFRSFEVCAVLEESHLDPKADLSQEQLPELENCRESRICSLYALPVLSYAFLGNQMMKHDVRLAS